MGLIKDKIVPFDFEIRTHVVFGEGRINALPDIIKSESFKSVCLVIDSAVKNNKNIKDAVNKISNTGASVHVFYNIIAEPDYDYLDKFKERVAGKNYDCIIGIGGGSTLDLAKGVATLLKNPGKAITYRGFPLLKNRPLPVIAVSTTAGTGSEVTYNAVFIDKKEKRKLGINSKFNYPLYAILDPKLTLSCPESVTVSSGMDAMVHTLESFVAKNANNYSRMFSRQAFQLLYNNLIKVLDNPNDIDNREKILLGSHYAGAALVNSGAGPAGAMSHPFGANFNIPHGIAGAVFLPKIVRFNLEKGYKGYHELYDLIENADSSLSIEEKNKMFVEKIDKLCSKLKVPNKLTVFGIKEKDIDFLVEQIFSGLKAAIDQNPVIFTKEDMKKILETMF